MPFFKNIYKNFSGKFFPGNPPIFTGSSPASGASSSVGATSGTTTVFTFQVADPFNRGNTRFDVTSGALPNGFVLDPTTGVLSGSYSLQGINTNGQVFNFSVTATDGSTTTPTRTSTTRNYSITLTVPFKFKQIISTSYLLGGYQNGVLWNNVNRCVHSTDTTTNLGDGFIDNFHYKSGASGYTKCFVWNGGSVTAFNMRNESKSNSGSTTIGGAANTGTVWDADRNFAWINGEGTGGTVRKWSFSTESMVNSSTSGWNDHAASLAGDTRGIWWNNGGGTARLIYSTESYANMGYSAGAHGQQKGMSSKDGKGYGGNEGNYNGGNNFRVTNIETESSQRSNVGKPFGNMGEENYTLGQDHTYCLGTYDGAQNNRAFRFTYATDSGSETGSTTQPKGKGGCSSGHCGWRD